MDPDATHAYPRASTESSDFASGQLVAGRYRIVAKLGQGGMGVVYRADDLLLDQPVALKFLPDSIAGDPCAMELLRNEVATARRVSHPHACRVYDLASDAQRAFLTMEFIDGEDLSNILRRLGKLSEEKGLEVARQICSALAAVHRQGVLHRDLKPSNVMLDGRGDVRLTDFGLAIEVAQGRDAAGGTLAYQSPEQLAGQGSSVQSDLFALGLVLCEVFTGKRAFVAASQTELMQRYADGWSADGVPLSREIEATIARCLQVDPKQRPASALAVAAALPGGDPFLLALEQGVTPSPEVVANATIEGSLPVPQALILLAIVLGGVLAAAALNERTMLFRRLPLPNSPAVLSARAQQLLTAAGYREPPGDQVFKFDRNEPFLAYWRQPEHGPNGWEGPATDRHALVYFWYAQSQRAITPSVLTFPDPPIYLDPRDVPLVSSGAAQVFFDERGRLLELYCGAPSANAPADSTGEFDWNALFQAAELDLADFEAVKPRFTPPVYCDSRYAWQGVYPTRQDLPLRIEAASYQGRPVTFRLIAPWSTPRDFDRNPMPEGLSWGNLVRVALIVGSLVLSTLLALANARRGTLDRRGAFRFGLFMFAGNLITWLLIGHHLASTQAELSLFIVALGISVFWGGFHWIAYLGFEPFIRRRWPWRIVSWSRLLAGRVFDPLIGRDILIGCVTGVALKLTYQLQFEIPGWLGLAPSEPYFIWSVALTNPVAEIARQTVRAVVDAVIWFPVLFLAARIAKSELVAASVLFLIAIPVFSNLNAQYLSIELGITALHLTIGLFVALRFGVLAIVSGFVFFWLLHVTPLTFDWSTWYWTSTATYFIVLASIALYGFYVSTSGRIWQLGRGLLSDF